MNKKYFFIFLLANLNPTISFALPSGFNLVPSNIQIPIVDGKALPVLFYADSNNAKLIYVQPTAGIFGGDKHLVKSPLTQCDALAEKLQMLKLDQEIRSNILRKIKEENSKFIAESDELARNLTELEKIKKMASALNLERTRLKETLVRLEAERVEAKSDTERTLLNQKINEATQKLEKHDSKISFLKSREADAEGEVTGKKAAVNEIAALLAEQEARLSTFTVKVEAALEKESKTLGGYLKLSMEFAPVDYLARLSTENPAYTFEYIPTLGTTIDITFPTTKEGSTLQSASGRLILDQKWNDAAKAHGENPFLKTYLAIAKPNADPLEEMQNLMAEFSGSLTGLKQVTLALSVLGYCAVMNPRIIQDELDEKAAQTFALSAYYSYPVHYDIRVSGKYWRNRILHELYEKSKSSSWFGLKKEEKQKFTRRFRDEEFINIKVDSSSPRFTQDDAMTLREKIADAIAFNSARDFIEINKNVPIAQFGDLNEERGASKVGGRLMKVPNKWVFWTGVVLKSLDEMFGSSSQSSEVDQVLSESKEVSWNMGFTLPHSADLTIGDLKNIRLVDR